MSNRCLPDRRRATTAPIVAITSLFPLAGGCASLANTPAQDVAWDRWSTCQTQVTGTDIRQVLLDGRIVFWYHGPGDRQAMLACLRQAASGGMTLPEPIADSRPRGG